MYAGAGARPVLHTKLPLFDSPEPFRGDFNWTVSGAANEESQVFVRGGSIAKSFQEAWESLRPASR